MSAQGHWQTRHYYVLNPGSLHTHDYLCRSQHQMKLLNELLELPLPLLLLLLLLLLLPLTPRLINERVPMTEMRFRTSTFHIPFSIFHLLIECNPCDSCCCWLSLWHSSKFSISCCFCPAAFPYHAAAIVLTGTNLAFRCEEGREWAGFSELYEDVVYIAHSLDVQLWGDH